MNQTKFLLKTALRDSRKDRGKLIMFMSSIMLGIAALVAINSFNDNLVKDIEQQAKSLLGADLVISGNRPASEEILNAFDSLPGERANELQLFSMAYFPSVDQTQFVKIRSFEGDFPFYGDIIAEPQKSVQEFRTSKSALINEGLMLQLNLEVKDSVKLGNTKFEIIGKLKTDFGGSGIGASFAPPVYISNQFLSSTNLVQPGSLVNYTYYAKLPDAVNADDWKDERNEAFRSDNMRMTTVADQKRNLTRAFESLNSFLNLVALVSLLLGCLGVASSVFIYVKSKIQSIAVFRCLGMKGKQAFLIYFYQILALGVISVISGILVGSGIQILLPMIMSDLLPFDVSTSLSWSAILEGLLIGTTITILFALLPLISIRKISPLRTLRTSVESDGQGRDLLRWVIYLSIFVSVIGFLWRLTGELKDGFIFAIGLLVSFLGLYLTSNVIMWAVKKFFPRKWSFVLRQGLSNLYRPNNQTQTLLVSIGLGTAVLTTLFIIQGLLLSNVSQMDAGNQPNIILYGVEKGQQDSIANLTESYDMPVIQQLPIVTMDLDGWKGKTKKEWLADTTANVRRWAATREARVTYRDYLDTNEELVKGVFKGKRASPRDSIFISLGEDYARGLQVDIGDEIIWNVQGLRMKTYVSSLRSMEFRNMQARFFIVFPTGVLENAPQFQVLVTKSPDVETTADYRKSVVKAFPNVSVVDLGSILSSLNDILNKVSYIIKFMAAFSILTGLIVLISSLLLSKFQRIRESVLLRTIGASRRHILSINATEYFLIGALSAATGIFISILGSWLLAKYQLELDFYIQWFPIFIVFLIVTLLTTFIGVFNSREVVEKSPLEVLRNV